MSWRCFTTLGFLALAACATPGPEPVAPVSPVENAVTDETSPTSADELEFEDAPAATEAAIVPAKDEVICRRERKTGTHRAIKVCRRVSDIQKESRQAKDAFEALRRSQVDGDL